MWDSWAPLLAPSGIFGVLAFFMYRLHKDAVNAERRRADAEERRAIAAEKRADLREEQLGILLGRKDPAL